MTGIKVSIRPDSKQEQMRKKGRCLVNNDFNVGLFLTQFTYNNFLFVKTNFHDVFAIFVA